MSKPAAWPRKLKLMATLCFSRKPGNHIAVKEESESNNDNDDQELTEDAEHALIAIEGRAHLTCVDLLHWVPLS